MESSKAEMIWNQYYARRYVNLPNFIKIIKHMFIFIHKIYIVRSGPSIASLGYE